ncbi:peptidoglycan DD-metalloendopeptidase family protein [Psychrobium sp. 1_MG-2023]|uniref:peptidoglycan DD-metalloendopeptidase family protein n=1 Tax=Psychrobium sp. 1_MG-2023 TaxID=3062624 RepID=UPI000C33482A|nr:peptidoglycan DD-metalloendopeptidase family protein [Psychrobium sp. 1_MG-2023]MDP2562025.1 peptidoglycan DD-metalloendopeptidase family protein [Psychrobium sp. 1_MG-2023]PKF58512.1 peptidase M23 [Alteromonadales bacterium alter-6D02]
MTHLYQRLPLRHKQLLIAVSVVTGFLFLLPSDNAKASKSTDSASTLEVAKRYTVDVPTTNIAPTAGSSLAPMSRLPEAPSHVTPQAIPHRSTEVLANSTTKVEPSGTALKQMDSLHWKKVKVKSGDNLALIFNRAGFSAKTLHKITSLGKATSALRKIMPGQVIHFGANSEQELVKLKYQQDIINTLEITKVDDKFTVEKVTKDLETRERIASATINSNFWNAAVDAGLEASVIMNLANIFGWDIDFGLDIRQGDHFSLVYETKYLDGVEVKTGKILAAEFINQGRSYQAIRHTDGEYYSATGRSMRKAFLRAPVNFKYISSNFNPRRLHPVTGRVKAHNGIDYAAKTGTPVVAAGSGTVIASAYNKYNGNYVFIKHGEKYVTKYLHLSKKFVRKGAKVKQGQRIGNVGATGRVTGAHLHYEFLVNGSHRNPRTVKLPKSQSIDRDEKSAFLAIASNRMEQLSANQRVMLATNNE